MVMERLSKAYNLQTQATSKPSQYSKRSLKLSFASNFVVSVNHDVKISAPNKLLVYSVITTMVTVQQASMRLLSEEHAV